MEERVDLGRIVDLCPALPVLDLEIVLDDTVGIDCRCREERSKFILDR